MSASSAPIPTVRPISCSTGTREKASTPKPINVDKDNFNDVMRGMNLNVNVNVANKLTGKEGDELGTSLNFATLKDFEPEQIARQVPELAKLLLSGLMIVGRLEIFPVLVLFTRDLWKR